MRQTRRVGRLGLALLLLLSVFGALTLAVTGATPAFAAGTYTCTAPAAGGTATSFDENVTNTYSVACYGVSGVSGTTAYPASITLASGSLPAGSTEATSTSSSPACATSHSGTGASEEYILTCAISDDPTPAQAGAYPATFSVTPGTDGGTGITSGTLTINVVNGAATACSAPASGGTSTTFTVGSADSYSVACYGTTGASYPPSITIASGTLPADASFPTTVGQGCTQSTSGSGASTEYILTCKITETPTAGDEGTYPLTFSATGAGGPTITSGTLTLKVSQTAPSWATSGSNDGTYFSAIKGVPFCDDIVITNPTVALPLTSLTAGTTPSGIANYSIQNVNLATGTAQLCGTDNNTPATSGTPPIMAPVATNTGGSATDSIPIGSQNECTWTASTGTVSMFDSNQDLEQAGSQSAFGQPISNGETAGTTTNYPTCSGDVMVAESGGLGDAWTVNTANPLPTPTDSNPSAATGDLPSSNLELNKGCYGGTNILSSYSYTSFGTVAKLTVPSPWVNGGDCSYGGLGSNSAGGNTDATNANCPPSQADVNAGYVSCSITVSSGNDENGSVNYSNMDLFFTGQPVPQQSTATLSAAGADAGGTLSVTGGTNWWGSSGGAPNTGPYGDDQAGAMYAVSAPGVFIGTSRGTAVPVVGSTVKIGANSYACTGAESTTVGPNPCTLTVGQPSGSFQLPAGLSPGSYNLYIDETNTTPLPGNGPNDAYQTARGTSLGTAESVTPIYVGPPTFTSSTSTTFAEATPGTFAVTANGDGPITYTESGPLPSGVTLATNGTLSGTPASGTAGSYPITITATDAKSDTTTQSFTLTVGETAPVFTSGTSTSFTENSAGTFAVTATGDTPITFTESGPLPSGVTLASDGTLSGTPALGTAGSYPITITATDTNSNTTTQSFTLTVEPAAPVFTSGTSTSFTENSAGTFAVTATGYTPITFTESGPLPSGVTLATNGTLSGTPAFGTAGSYPITITATDTNTNTSTQSFTLTVTAGGPV
ncbi:MAG: putative Ig domain-containing protein, partial [Acidimicrobiales bacterium]